MMTRITGCVTLIFIYEDVCVPNTLDDLQKDYGEWRLQRSPEYSTAMKFHKYNDKTETFAYNGFDEEFVYILSLLERLSKYALRKHLFKRAYVVDYLLLGANFKQEGVMRDKA